MECVRLSQTMTEAWLPDGPPAVGAPESARQAALEYLRAAERSEDRGERAVLRRRAADLILLRAER
jgi:hypothetical protein